MTPWAPHHAGQEIEAGRFVHRRQKLFGGHGFSPIGQVPTRRWPRL
jgi:hypothetical protein